MNPPAPSPLERAIVARQAYFEHGLKPDDLIDDAIFRSWTRCTAADRRERDPVEFEPVGRAMLRGLLERGQPLLQAAAGPLDKLARAVSGAGYAVLMTDGAGYALSVGGALNDRPHPMRLAFRQGVDLSEGAIGTSAMSCALSERRAIRVFGPEHFFSATRMFHCAAAPILAPDGSLAGVVDITRDSPRPDFGALALVSQCARAIERELFRARPAAHTLTLSWDDSRPEDAQDLLVALGADGEILGMNEQARRFLGERGEGGDHGRGAALHFGDLFEGRFQACMDALRQARSPVPLRLHSGLCLFASAGGPVQPALAAPPPARPPAAPPQSVLPEFGDAGIPRQLETALRALANHLPVLLLGETGSGKEVAADCLHRRSPRAAGPLVALNCAAIPETLIESELFGHVEGAYTGARRGGMPGKIELADGGSLFLDEIGDMPLALQARLLRVLETRELSRLGSTASRRVDFQLICATHRDLQQAMGEGLFRADLYYRIAGFTVTLPPLRERCGLAALMEALLAEVSAGRRSLAPAALARLLAHPWPGNARELRHALTYAHTVAEPGRPLQPDDFPALAPPQAAPAAASGLLATLEEEAIQRALKETSGKVAAAARLLGMSRATLYRRLRGRR